MFCVLTSVMSTVCLNIKLNQGLLNARTTLKLIAIGT